MTAAAQTIPPCPAENRDLPELVALADKWGMPACEGPRNPKWIPSALRWCERHGLDINEACQLVVARLTRPPKGREIERAARLIYSTDALPLPRSTYWPLRSDSALAQLWNEHPAGAVDVFEASPIRLPEDDGPLDVLSLLHPDDALLYLAPQSTSTKGAEIKTLAEWRADRRDLRRWEMVVPNACSKRTGINMEGDPSLRCRDTACGMENMRFAVVEPDYDENTPLVQSGVDPLDLCASAILRLLKRSRLVMVVMSGGKSLHAWMNVTGIPHRHLTGFYQQAAPYGIDPAGRLPEQQFRLPNGTRSNGVKQSVLYYNPEALIP